MGNENIGSRLKEVRTHLDLSQKAFANLIGVTQTTISGIESGRANPSRHLLKNVCMGFGVSEDWLAEGKGNMLCIPGSGKTAAAAGGDLISRNALMEAMAGISLDTEEDVRAWIEAELLVEEAPSVPDRPGDTEARRRKLSGNGVEKMEWWQEQILEEYKQSLYEKKMQDYAYQCERTAPHVIHGARVMQDGNQWCCILGDLPTGVAGFGDTPEKACAEFDRVWRYGNGSRRGRPGKEKENDNAG